jgi:hypothetical protein
LQKKVNSIDQIISRDFKLFATTLIPESGNGQSFQVTDQHLARARVTNAVSELLAKCSESRVARLKKGVAHDKMEVAQTELLNKCAELLAKCDKLPMARLEKGWRTIKWKWLTPNCSSRELNCSPQVLKWDSVQ